MSRTQVVQLSVDELNSIAQEAAQTAVKELWALQKDEEEKQKQYPPLEGFLVSGESTEAKHQLRIETKDRVYTYFSDASIHVTTTDEFVIFQPLYKVYTGQYWSGQEYLKYTTGDQRIAVSIRNLIDYSII